ncbi:MAG: GEVED domain-containing protein [Bacteroidota bacterium]
MKKIHFSLFARIILSFFACFATAFSLQAQVVSTITTTGAGTWTAPCGITSITLELWGAGGGGQRANGNPSMGGGGSGGGYVKVTYPVSPGTTYNFYVGNGGSGNSGQDGEATWFDATTKMLAVNGVGAGATLTGSSSYGTGAIALTSGNIIDPSATLLFSNYGGNGGNGQNLATDISGGGGASGGSTQLANRHASGMTGGTAQTDGYAGVNGRNSNGNGADGNIGAGGAGGRAGNNTNRLGGDGGNGQIRMSYAGNSYCAVNFTNNTEPITNVTFLATNNTTSGVLNGTPDLEDFSGINCGANTAQQNSSFNISVSGNTDGNWTNYIRVYADWNHDNDFDDAGESFNIGTIVNCASCSVSGTIDVPCDATLGNTRMRVFKDYGAYPTNSCTSSNGWGQVEDYTIVVTAGSGGYVSSTATQANVSHVLKGTTNQEVMGIEIVMNGCKDLTSLTLNTAGTTSISDITNARLWYTATSSTFATTTQFGSTVAAPNGAFSFNGTQNLASGTHYFWLTYDVPAAATSGNFIDAQVSSITIDGSANTPGVTSPAGNRMIYAVKNWIGDGTPTSAGPDFNTATNWSPTGVPGPVDDAIMAISSDATVTFSSASTAVGTLDITVNGSNDNFVLNVAGNTFTVNGTTDLNITGGNNATSLIVSVGNGGTINYNGNTTFSATSGNTYGIYATGGSTGVVNVSGNLTYSNARAITSAANLPAYVNMDGTGNQTMTFNNAATTFPHLQIGNANTPTVTIAGSVTNALRPNDLTVKGTLVIPTGFVVNRGAAGGTFTMTSGSLMRLQGTTGGQTGSNFPLSYSTMSLNNNSTVEYYGTGAQTIYAGTSYGHLTLTNNSNKSATAALTVNGNLTINATATFAAGTSLTHNVGGNWTNNGTFSYTTANTINFNGNNVLQTISGSSTTGFYNVIVNKGAAYTNILDVTSLITLNNATNPLTLTNGSFRLSSASTITPFTTNPSIPATAGFINNGGTVNAGNFHWGVSGLFRNTAGTTNIGTASGDCLIPAAGSLIEIQGGTVNVAGRLQCQSSSTYNQSGGTINLCQIGNLSTSIANFHMVASSNLNITGGTVVMRLPSTSGTPYNAVEILSGAGMKSISGGTFQFGDASTPASRIFLVNSAIPFYNVTINNTNAPVVRPVTNHLTIGGTLTMNGGNIDGATNTRDVVVTNNAVGAVVRTAGLINYNLKRTIGSTGAAYLFPVGNGTNYNPANITFTNLTPGDLNIRSISGDEPNITSSGIDNTISVNAYWALTASAGLVSTSYAGTMTYLAAQNDVAAQAANYITGIYNSSWSYPTVSGTPTSTSLSFTAASGFGNLAIGKCKTPPAAVAGSAQNICAVSATLAATAVALPARGTWSVVSGTGGSFSDVNSPTATFTGSGAYTLRWSVAYPGSSCTVNTNDVNITLNPPPTASAGGVISAFVGEYLTVSGASATNGSILWTHNGTGYYDQTYFPAGNETTTTPTYYTEAGDFGQTVNLTMTVTGTGTCSATTATANYTINVDGRPALWTYQCGTTLADINDYIYAYAYPGATQYRFRINDGGTTQTFDTPASVFYFTQFPTYAYNTTYTVDVSVFVAGAWTAYGPTCSISTPTLPLAKVMASQCGATLATMGTPIYADLIEGASQYRFRVSDGVSTQTFDNPSRMFNMTQFSGYAYGTAYTIDVAAYYGFWQPYGASCVVTTPSLPTTQMMASHCGTTVANADVDLYADEVPGATQYRFRATNGSSITVDKPSRTFKFSQMSGILAGTAYTVDVAAYVNGSWGPYGSTCTISTPAAASPQLIASQCGSVLTDIFTDLFCNEVSGATQYRFRVTNGNGAQAITKPSRTFKLAQLSNVEYGTVNTVECDAFVSGAWIGYGSVCNVTTPAVGATKIVTSQCGTTLSSGSQALYADEVPGATQYRFRVVNGTDTSIVTKSSRTFTIIEVDSMTILINTTYIVDVAVYYQGSWLTYGADCNLTTPGTLIALFTTEVQDEQTLTGQDDTQAAPAVAGAEEVEAENTSIVAFPNPFESNFKLDFVSESSDDVQITLFDASGKLVESFKATTKDLETLKIGETYQAGMYLLNIQQGTRSTYLKVIKR